MRMSDTDVDASSYYDTFASEIDAVYRELGSIDDALFCTCNVDYVGWYRERSDAGGEWDGNARALALGREFQLIRQQMDPRVIHATTSYATDKWFIDAWTRYRWDETDDGDADRQWDGDAGVDQDTRKPVPNYADHAAYAPFVDIDLVDDDLKAQRAAGDLDTAPIEAAISETVDPFADLADERAAVRVLDSVGGVYVLLSPTVTRPICRAFDAADRGTLIEDLTQQLNEWLDRVEQDVFATVPDAADLIKFDTVNNKNRAYKAPLSLHKDLDAVVTPIDPDDVTYMITPIDAVDDALIDEAREWAAQYTADHSDAVAAVVRALWPAYFEDADGWREALQDRLDDLTTEQETRRRDDETRTPYPTRDGTPTGIDLDDLDVTDDIDVVHAAVESIDMSELAERLAVEWETAGGRSKPRFAAPWYTTHNSGQACYVIDDDRFYDTVAEAGGGPLQFIAAERGIINAPGEKITGDDYWRAVEALRDEGYHIPRFRGKDGTHKDALKVYADTEDDDLKAMLRDVMAGE